MDAEVAIDGLGTSRCAAGGRAYRILADARQPWQPGPVPRDAAAAALPERQASAHAIEPDT